MNSSEAQKMQYTVCELHCHTSETSSCGHVSAKDLVPFYKENGYDLIVITDHYNADYFPDYIAGKMSWGETMEKWFLGWRTAKAAGDKCGIRVLHGCEFRFPENHNDYLVYGMTEEAFLEKPLFMLSFPEFVDYARQHGLFVAQAHPFRPGQIPADPKLLEGVEIYNSHPLHNAHNDIAKKFAEDNGLIGICGQDFHQYPAMLGCKTKFYGDVDSIPTLIAKLRAREFEIIEPEHPAVYEE